MPTAREILANYATSTDNMFAVSNTTPSWAQKKHQKQQRLSDRLSTLTASGALLDGRDDGDSSKYLRYEGIDTPETFHELDLHNEKTKMAKQYMQLHPEVTPQEAYATVEGQYAAFKIAKEQGQDLPQLITDYRKQGLISSNFEPTAFDIHQAGTNATNYASQYDQDNFNNQTTGFSAAGNLVDGSTGYFDRFMVKDDKYRDATIAQGYAIPGASDKELYKKQLQSTAEAKNKKLGNYATATGAKVMDAIITTSSAKRFTEGGMKSTGEMLHYESPEEFQYQVGAKISDGQLTRDAKTGKYYEEIIVDGGKNKVVEVHADDVSSMYVAGNKQGTSTKLGVARADLKQEMWDKYGESAPMVARYMDKRGYNPYLSNYKAKKGEVNPSTGGKALGYDGTPGPEGIDVDDPDSAVIYMRTNAVEALEKYVHTQGGQIEARTAGSDALLPGKTSSALDKRFGAGTSEYTKSTGAEAGPLWNKDYDMDRVGNITAALKAEPMPSKSKAWEKIKKIQKEDPTAPIAAKDINTPPYNETPTEKYNRLYNTDNAKEGRIGETIDMAQAAIVKFGADTVNMLENLVGKDNIAKYDAWAGEIEKKMGGDGKAGWFIGEEERKTIESMRDMPTAQKEFGVSQSTINDHNAAMKESEEMWVHAKTPVDYIKSLGVAMSQLDRILAGSAGEIAGLMIPGGPAVVAATRTSNFAEEYELNNDKVMSKAKLAQTFFTEIVLLVPEKLLIKAGITDIVEKTAGSTFAGRMLTASAGEGLQEYGEGISEEIATQKEGDRTVLEIATDPTTVHQAAIGVGMGAGMKAGGESISVAPKIIKKSLGKAVDILDKATTSKTAKAATEAIPGSDAKVVSDIDKQYKDTVTSTLATQDKTELDGTKAAPVTPLPIKEHAAVVAETYKAPLEDSADTKDSQELTDLSTEFDTKFDEAVAGLTGLNVQVKEALEAAGREPDAAEDAQIASMATPVADAVLADLTAIADKISETAGPKRKAAVQAKIEAIIPLTAISTTKELDAIITSKSITQATKIRAVLGSSAATVENVAKVLEFVPKDSRDYKILTAKYNALKGTQYTASEKLFGGGVKPGVFQWLSLIKDGKASPIVIQKVEDFVVGQRTKLIAFKEAVRKWDAEAKAPWIDGNPILSDKGKELKDTPDNRAAWRSSTYNNTNNNTTSSISVDYDGWSGKVLSAADLAITIEAENVDMENLWNEISTSPAPQKDAKKASKPEVDTKPKPATKKAPVEAISGEEKVLSRIYNIASDMANGRAVSKEDKQFSADNKAAITKLINSDESLKTAMRNTLDSRKKSPAPKESPEARETSLDKQAYLGSEEALAKAVELTNIIYDAGVAQESGTEKYKATVQELIDLISQSNVSIAPEQVNKLEKVLIKDNLKATTSKKVNNLLKYLSKGKPLTKTYKKTLEELLPQIIKEQSGKTSTKKLTKYPKGTLHGAAKAKNEAAVVPVGGAQETANAAVNIISKKEYQPIPVMEQAEADEAQRMYEEEQAYLADKEAVKLEKAIITKEEGIASRMDALFNSSPGLKSILKENPCKVGK